ncbi:MAG: SAM-dependent chlorinase/fluorinase [Chloroflexota bacterium]|nr:SAM-dependent chlorinase/fluorinase [Chloroflexota bacterium]
MREWTIPHPEATIRHITLLTDFGTTEGEHTVMKGVIWRILPGASIADLSHDIGPQNIREAALVLFGF